LTWME